MYFQTYKLKLILSQFDNTFFNFARHYASRNKFYKNSGILKSGDSYEVILDQRKLKTPGGNVFSVNNESLALAVATEWNVKKKELYQSNMHLTTLTNTIMDNPSKLTKTDIVNYIINYLDTDTVLFQDDTDEDLINLQINEWNPIIEWFNNKFNVSLKTSNHMDIPLISNEDKALLTRQLMSYSFATLNGYMYGVDTLKSVILTLAATERFLLPEKAVFLSRLEEEYQAKQWGRLEWAHDLNHQELLSRLSAVVLFVYFDTQAHSVLKKKTNI